MLSFLFHSITVLLCYTISLCVVPVPQQINKFCFIQWWNTQKSNIIKNIRKTINEKASRCQQLPYSKVADVKCQTLRKSLRFPSAHAAAADSFSRWPRWLQMHHVWLGGGCVCIGHLQNTTNRKESCMNTQLFICPCWNNITETIKR